MSLPWIRCTDADADQKNQSDENMWRRITHREPRVRTQSWRLFLQFVEQRDEPDEAINQAEKTKTNNHWL